MDVNQIISHVNQAIEDARNGVSLMADEMLQLGGFSTPAMRRFFNNVCRLPDRKDPVYLEAGVFKGGTLLSALSRNPKLTAFAWEDWSQPFGEGNVREAFLEAYGKMTSEDGICLLKESNFFEADFFQLLPRSFVDVFFYDAEHSEESQARALPFTFPVLADTFIYIVDDYAWAPVREGANKGLFQLKDKLVVDHYWELKGELPNGDPIWHNSMGIWLCRKL